MVRSHVCRGRPRGRLQSLGGLLIQADRARVWSCIGSERIWHVAPNNRAKFMLFPLPKSNKQHFSNNRFMTSILYSNVAASPSKIVLCPKISPPKKKEIDLRAKTTMIKIQTDCIFSSQQMRNVVH